MSFRTRLSAMALTVFAVVPAHAYAQSAALTELRIPRQHSEEFIELYAEMATAMEQSGVGVQPVAQNLLQLDVGLTGIYDVDAVSAAPNLQVLKAGGNRLQFVNIVDPLSRLEVLDLSENPLFDVYQLRFLQALKKIKHAANQLTNDAVILDHLGDVYLALNNKARALENWRKSYKIDSKNEKVLKTIRKYGGTVKKTSPKKGKGL